MADPKKYILTSNEDILYFYDLSFKNRGLNIKNRKSLKDLSKKFNIDIQQSSEGTCKDRQCEPNKILIFEEKGGLNERFFKHLRNAFAHCQIEISEGRCRLLDWISYENNKKVAFSKKRVTLLGDVDYDDFKKLMDEFFSIDSIKKKQNK